MKYAHRENERRFLVAQLPTDLGEGTLIEDRYLDHLRIRLRRMANSQGEVFKITQKIPEGPSVSLNTTFYLDAAEYTYLKRLPGHDLRKTRYRVMHEGKAWAIDVFEGRDLVLAEIELGENEDLQLPPFLGDEVTHDERFSGGRLAMRAE